MPRSPERCGIKGCSNLLGPGAAVVGYENEGKIIEVRVCPRHAWEIMTAPRGTFRITPDRRLEKLTPQQRIII